MSETLNMRTSRVIPTETKGIFSSDVSRKSSKLKIAKSLIVHVLSILVIMSPDLSLDMNGKQRSKGAFVSPTKLYSTMSV